MPFPHRFSRRKSGVVSDWAHPGTVPGARRSRRFIVRRAWVKRLIPLTPGSIPLRTGSMLLARGETLVRPGILPWAAAAEGRGTPRCYRAGENPRVRADKAIPAPRHVLTCVSPAVLILLPSRPSPFSAATCLSSPAKESRGARPDSETLAAQPSTGGPLARSEWRRRYLKPARGKTRKTQIGRAHV